MISGEQNRAIVCQRIHLEYSIDDLIAEGDKVMARWSASGTQSGMLLDIPPTGRQARWTGMYIFRLDSGKIFERWENFDALGVLQQLGTMPPIINGRG